MATVISTHGRYTYKHLLNKNGIKKRARSPKTSSSKLNLKEKEEQIVGTQAKSQQIVAQRLLSCLQYLDATKSSAKDLSFSPVNLKVVGNNFCRLVTSW